MTQTQNQNTKSRIFTSLISISILTLFAVFISCNSNKRILNDSANRDLLRVHENNSTVAAFISYVDANNKLVPDHTVINNALVKLADATSAMAGEIGYTITEDLNMAKMYANDITKNHNESTHADNIRKSADILSNALGKMQAAKYPTLASASAELINASAAIKSETLTNNQKDEIVAFFRRSAYLLEKMN